MRRWLLIALGGAVCVGCWIQPPAQCVGRWAGMTRLCTDPNYAVCTNDAGVVFGCNVGRVTCVRECP